MLRSSLSLSFLASALLVAAFQAPTQRVSHTSPRAAAGDPVSHCPDRLPVSPLLVYDVSGTTLFGPAYTHVAVYDDGHVMAAQLGADPSTGQMAIALLTPEELQQMRSDLELWGAFGLCDEPASVSDVPVTTVSVFRGGTESTAHTFSYLVAGGAHGGVQQIVDQLLASKFPGF